jgi:hypothetical protein
MPIVQFSDSDLLRNKIVAPAWYRLQLGMVSEWAESKAKDSNNCTVEGVILFNADNGDEEFKGVPITLQFNDKPKAKGFIEGFLRALGVDVQAGRYDLGAASGQQIEAYIENDTYEGRILNRCNHKYRLVRK